MRMQQGIAGIRQDRSYRLSDEQVLEYGDIDKERVQDDHAF